jgi:hypothetical protein
MRISITTGLLLAVLALPARAADDYKWVYSQTADMVELSYLIPDSDAIDTIFSCKPGGKSPGGRSIGYMDVETTEKLLGKSKATIIIRVGGKSFTLKGKLLPNEEAGVPSFEAFRAANHPLWAALAKAADFETEIAGEKESHTLKGAEMAKFVKACGG